MGSDSVKKKDAVGQVYCSPLLKVPNNDTDALERDADE